MATKDVVVVLPPINIAYSEMVEVDQSLVIGIAINALKAQDKGDRTIHHKDIAQMVKLELDNQKGGAWNVIVGKSFGSFVTHEAKTVFGVYDRGCNHTYSNVRKLSFDLRLALAGGIAGGISTLILHPIDTYKTMLQADMTVSSIRTAFQRLKERGFSKAYSGSVAAVLGAIPSSSLYFGTYEFSKKLYGDFLFPLSNRALIHMMSAASGNIISSLIFVPKEVVKQKLQALKTSAVTTPIDSTTIVSVMNSIFRQRGLKGFYSGYRATLFRNIPSAIIRFTLYEELKLLLAKNEKMRDNRWHDLCYLFAGSLASSVSTALTTPIDVIKTRMAVESIPSGTNFITAFKLIAKREGLRSLFTGVKARIVWSSLYGGIGLFCFEQCKKLLQVED